MVNELHGLKKKDAELFKKLWLAFLVAITARIKQLQFIWGIMLIKWKGSWDGF